jgi:uncharacterized membrane protein YjfL (UPF0719 family)
MYKLIALLVAAIPVILFLKTVFFGRSRVLKQASADFRKQVDYMVWAILFIVACGIVYAILNLLMPLWR